MKRFVGNRLKGFVSGLFLATAIVQNAPADTLAESSLTVLVDLSGSYFNERQRSLMKRNLDEVNEAVEEITQLLPPPVDIFYLSIANVSLSMRPLCSAKYQRTMLFPKEGVISNKRALKNFLIPCRDKILRKPSSGHTDIVGAVNLSSRLSPGPSAQKALIIISDMEEDPPEGAATGRLDLKGYRIAIVYRIRKEDGSRPRVIDERLASWSKRFKASGADEVVFVIEQKNFSADLVQALVP